MSEVDGATSLSFIVTDGDCCTVAQGEHSLHTSSELGDQVLALFLCVGPLWVPYLLHQFPLDTLGPLDTLDTLGTLGPLDTLSLSTLQVFRNPQIFSPSHFSALTWSHTVACTTKRGYWLIKVMCNVSDLRYHSLSGLTFCPDYLKSDKLPR